MVRQTRIERSVNEVLLPVLQTAGFAVISNGETQVSWKEGTHLRRVVDAREQIVLISRTRGSELGFNVAKQNRDGSYSYLDPRRHGIEEKLLSYGESRTIDDAMRYLANFLVQTALPWCDTP